MASDKIYNLFGAYDRAAFNLIQRRNRDFPAGTKVLSRISNTQATVINGSLYPDQVNTDRGHMGWRSLEKLP